MLRTRALRRCALAVATAALTVLATASVTYADQPVDAQSPTPTSSPAPTESPSPTELPTPPADPVAMLNSTPPPEADLETRGSCWVYVEVAPGEFTYVNICDSPGDDDEGNDDGGNGEWEGPSCDLSYEPYDEFCDGEKACWADIPSPIAEDEWPEEHRPSENHIFTHFECILPPDTETRYPDTGWIDPYENSLPDQGWAAWGKLQTPAFTLGFEPADLTYVGADTTFDVDGTGDGEIVGTPAGNVYAVGSLSHVEVDPGDGNETVRCDNDPETDECVHVYLDTSLDEQATDLTGRAAFHAQARLVYDVTYFRGGEPISLPGVPDVLESPWNGTLVPVGEIQVLVQ